MNEYLFPGIRWPDNVTAQTKGKDARLEFDVEAGSVYYVKVDTEKEGTGNSTLTPRLFLMTYCEGEHEIRSCRSVSDKQSQ